MTPGVGETIGTVLMPAGKFGAAIGPDGADAFFGWCGLETGSFIGSIRETDAFAERVTSPFSLVSF